MPTLYVTEPGAMLEKEAGQLLVTLRGEVLFAAPARQVDQVVLVGHAGVTTPALDLCLTRRIGLVILSHGGAFRGRLVPDNLANLDLRRQQYRRAEDEAFCLAVGRAVIAGKIRNARALLMRLDETNADPATLAAAAEMRAILARLPQAASRPALMGLEGQAARLAFGALRGFLRPPWTLPARARRPPPDPVNALLSLLYTLLHERCHAALMVTGLDPACGFLHQPRSGRASLALDLMEEFRPVIAESTMLTLLNKRMLSPEDFTRDARGGVILSRAGWRTVVAQFGERLATEVRPSGVKRAISYQKVLEVQARKLRRAVLDGAPYESFRAR